MDQLTPTTTIQKPLLDSDKKFNILKSYRRSGKSTALYLKAIRDGGIFITPSHYHTRVHFDAVRGISDQFSGNFTDSSVYTGQHKIYFKTQKTIPYILKMGFSACLYVINPQDFDEILLKDLIREYPGTISFETTKLDCGWRNPTFNYGEEVEGFYDKYSWDYKLIHWGELSTNRLPNNSYYWDNVNVIEGKQKVLGRDVKLQMWRYGEWVECNHESN